MKIEIAWSFFIEHITFSYTWKKKKNMGFIEVSSTQKAERRRAAKVWFTQTNHASVWKIAS